MSASSATMSGMEHADAADTTCFHCAEPLPESPAMRMLEGTSRAFCCDGCAAAAQWIANFAITMSFPTLSAFSLPITYGMYALFAALSFFFVLKVVPETKGMRLEDADTLLAARKIAP